MIKEGIHIGDDVKVEYGDGSGRTRKYTGKLTEYYEDEDFPNEGRVQLEVGQCLFAGENQWIKVFN